MRSREADTQSSDKISSGIAGFDEITGGGLPRGRITVVLGGAGCEKTIFALHLRQKQGELALAETRVRIEAARSELALREADLHRILATRDGRSPFASPTRRRLQARR